MKNGLILAFGVQVACYADIASYTYQKGEATGFGKCFAGFPFSNAT